MRAFAEAGGVVIADNSVGWMNEHCRTLDRGRLDGLFGAAAAHRLPRPPRRTCWMLMNLTPPRSIGPRWARASLPIPATLLAALPRTAADRRPRRSGLPQTARRRLGPCQGPTRTAGDARRQQKIPRPCRVLQRRQCPSIWGSFVSTRPAKRRRLLRSACLGSARLRHPHRELPGKDGPYRGCVVCGSGQAVLPVAGGAAGAHAGLPTAGNAGAAGSLRLGSCRGQQTLPASSGWRCTIRRAPCTAAIWTAVAPARREPRGSRVPARA